MSEERGRQQEVKEMVWPTEKDVDARPPIKLPHPEPQTQAETALEVAESSGTELPRGIAADSTHAFIFAHAREGAAVLRTIVRKNVEGDGPLAGVAGKELAATFVIGAGEEVSARVLGELEGDEMRPIAEGVVKMEEASHHACMHALELVRKRIEEEDYLDLGGEKYARNVLGRVMESYRVDWMVEGAQLPEISGFEMLERMKSEQISPFIAHEHPQTVALILSQLKPVQAAGILANLPERMQADVAYRLTTLEEVSTLALTRVEESLTRSLRSISAGTVRAGGAQATANMLNLSGSSVERNVLDQMEAQDPETAEGVRMYMFTFNDIAILKDDEIRLVIGEVDQSDLALALRVCNEELKERFRSVMEDDSWRNIEELLEYAGPVRMSEVEAVQQRIIQHVRKLEEEGKVTIVRGAPDELV
ncbi:MAG: flagellar motor switch protein FliG [Gemmatimonadetes bacterium]|nr:flagellar motor switch protein FliG [Gemmatimonadota bacterium]